MLGYLTIIDPSIHIPLELVRDMLIESLNLPPIKPRNCAAFIDSGIAFSTGSTLRYSSNRNKLEFKLPILELSSSCFRDTLSILSESTVSFATQENIIESLKFDKYYNPITIDSNKMYTEFALLNNDYMYIWNGIGSSKLSRHLIQDPICAIYAAHPMTFTIASSFNNELYSFDTRSSRADVIKSVDTPIVNLTKSIDSLFLFSYTTNSEMITIDLRNTSEALKIIDISSENVNYFASSKKGIYSVSSSITFYPSTIHKPQYIHHNNDLGEIIGVCIDSAKNEQIWIASESAVSICQYEAGEHFIQELDFNFDLVEDVKVPPRFDLYPPNPLSRQLTFKNHSVHDFSPISSFVDGIVKNLDESCVKSPIFGIDYVDSKPIVTISENTATTTGSGKLYNNGKLFFIKSRQDVADFVSGVFSGESCECIISDLWKQVCESREYTVADVLSVNANFVQQESSSHDKEAVVDDNDLEIVVEKEESPESANQVDVEAEIQASLDPIDLDIDAIWNTTYTDTTIQNSRVRKTAQETYESLKREQVEINSLSFSQSQEFVESLNIKSVYVASSFEVKNDDKEKVKEPTAKKRKGF